MLTVSVISPERVLFEGEASSVVAPAYDGEVGILTDHAPMMTLLGRGTLRVDASGGAQRYDVSGGFLQVLDNTVRVVTEHAQPL
ncbi:MAG TPA: ATP synthase F1 subunit epsilon [Gemmatimonadaceae bacterium]|jgi:F-type H+-transporting ATPase subunit epsilon|nr:ATP synthase F1 subunit epsilon [Gemmatimonadaceae bacterium]